MSAGRILVGILWAHGYGRARAMRAKLSWSGIPAQVGGTPVDSERQNITGFRCSLPNLTQRIGLLFCCPIAD